MKRSESGFTLIELLLVTAIVAGLALAAGATTLQLFASSKRSNDHMTAVRQVQNAGYWLSRDALMAQTITTADDEETPEVEFITLKWTEWGYEENSTYHSATYSFHQDLSADGIGKIRRTHWSSETGESEETLVAEYIYYTGDPENTTDTEADYEDPPVLTVQIAASIGEANETKEYRVWRRPNF